MSRMSYGQVRDYVKSRAGAVDTTILETLMVQCLQDMNADLGHQEVLASATLNLTSGDAYYDVPTGMEKVLSVLDENGCPLARHEPTCPGDPCNCSTPQYRSEDEMAYKVESGVITFYPTPSTSYQFLVKGLGQLDTTLYDLDGEDVVWRWVALPDALHQSYANRVLGMAIADFDPGRAQVWLGFSNQSFDAWKSRIGKTGEAADETVVMNRYGNKRRPYEANSVEIFQRVSE